MAWIKRNLFFFIGGLVALGLLAAAGLYNYANWSRNNDQMDNLSKTFDELKEVSKQEVSPGDEQHPRIQEAKDQEAQLIAWKQQVMGYFQPIDPVPASTKANPVTSESFAAALRRTIDTLKHEAEASHVVLPPDYGFSFTAEQSRVTFSPGSLDLLAGQLGEVKTITEILYAAGVNNFDGIQRVKVAAEDETGPASDYTTELPVNNNLTTMTPYVVTFRSFTPEIAHVFAGLAASPHGFIVKSLNVNPASTDATAPPNPNENQLPPKGTLVTFLKEKLLRVSMVIEVAKLKAQ